MTCRRAQTQRTEHESPDECGRMVCVGQWARASELTCRHAPAVEHDCIVQGEPRGDASGDRECV